MTAELERSNSDPGAFVAPFSLQRFDGDISDPDSLKGNETVTGKFERFSRIHNLAKRITVAFTDDRKPFPIGGPKQLLSRHPKALFQGGGTLENAEVMIYGKTNTGHLIRIHSSKTSRLATSQRNQSADKVFQKHP